MKLLLQQVTILDGKSPYHLQKKDILIENGLITQIDNSITEKADTTIAAQSNYVSTGFADVFCHFNEPGYEYKETLETGAKAAFKGGYTSVMTVPNTLPVMDNKIGIENVQHKSQTLPVHIHPIGAVTASAQGKQLAEMMEMRQSGAIAFSDGTNCIQNAGVMLKALQYVKAIDGIIIQMPNDSSLSANGFMHEGIISTQLGLMGIPALAEELMVERDIALCAYANSKLHITGISTAKSVALIKEAKAKGLHITCSVAPYHLLLTDADVANYDTNCKVLNPLRTTADVIALQNALLDGTIDAIASHHQPQDADNKKCEFAYAAYGMSTIEHCFNAIASVPNITPQKIHELLCSNVHTIFNITKPSIAVNEVANLVVFNTNKITSTKNDVMLSKSKNSALAPFLSNGNIVATVQQHHQYIAS
jgi:dihydroorotase